MRLDVRKSAELSAAIAVMATLDREVAKATRTHSKRVIQPEWQKALDREATRDFFFFSHLTKNSSALVSDRGVKLTAGRTSATSLVREREFGASREEFNTYTRRGRNGSYQVRRRTQRQFYHYNADGYVVYPAARKIIPRVAALWVQTVYRTTYDAIEGAMQ